MSTLLSGWDDRLAQRDFQGASRSKKLLSEFSLRHFDTHSDKRQLNSPDEIRVLPRRPALSPSNTSSIGALPS